MMKSNDTDEKIRQHLREVMERRNLSQRAVAQMAGMKPQVLNAYLLGRRGFGRVTIGKLARGLNVSEGYLIGGKGNVSDKMTELLDDSTFGPRTPIVSLDKAAQWDEYTDVSGKGYTTEWLRFKVRDEHDIAIRMLDDSMEPEFMKGCIIILGRPVGNLNGKYVLAKVDGAVLFRRYRRFDHGVVLSAANTSYKETVIVKEESARLRVTGMVVGQVRFYTDR